MDFALPALLLFLARGQGGGGGGAPAPSPAPVPPTRLPGPLPPLPQKPLPQRPAPAGASPFPQPPPANLPPWPSGWEPDEPPPPEVVTRAWALLSTLWQSGQGTRKQEMTGGRWLTYVAEMHGNKRGVTAYRPKRVVSLRSAPVAPRPAPAPAGPVATPQAPHPVPASTPPLVSPYPGTGAYKTNAAYITRYQAALSWLANTLSMPAWNPGAIDGTWGPHTDAAVRAFQKDNGLPVDGAAGADTAAMLDSMLGTGTRQG